MIAEFLCLTLLDLEPIMFEVETQTYCIYLEVPRVTRWSPVRCPVLVFGLQVNQHLTSRSLQRVVLLDQFRQLVHRRLWVSLEDVLANQAIRVYNFNCIIWTIHSLQSRLELHFGLAEFAVKQQPIRLHQIRLELDRAHCKHFAQNFEGPI